MELPGISSKRTSALYRCLNGKYYRTHRQTKSRTRCTKPCSVIKHGKGTSRPTYISLVNDGKLVDGSYNNPSDTCTSIGIEPDLFDLSRIYFRRCMLQDSELIGLESYYIDHLVNLIFVRGFTAKKVHLDRDIIDLVKIIEIPENALRSVGMSRRHRISVFSGIAFYGKLFHPEKPFQLKNCRILLTRSFLFAQKSNSTYETILDVVHSTNYIDELIDIVVNNGIQLILSEDYLSPDISQLLYERGVRCFCKIKYKILCNIAFALKCKIATSVDRIENYEMFIGTNTNFKVLQNGLTSIAMLTLVDEFKGFTILVSKSNSRFKHIIKLKKLIKMSIVRLQGIVEELQIVKDLEGTFDTSTYDLGEVNSVNKNIYCQYFSDFLHLLLSDSCVGNKIFRPMNLVYVTLDHFFKDTMNCEISYKKYRRTTNVKCFKYYTKTCELCCKPTHETIPIGNYTAGTFLSNFVAEYIASVRSNKCIAKADCTEPFINHQLHFETYNLGTENMRLSLYSEYTGILDKNGDLSVEVHCNICGDYNIFLVKDITFGRFITLLLCNVCYTARCGHLLFRNSCFSVLMDSYRIFFKVNNVTTYKIYPVFNTSLYNCLKGSLYYHGLCNINQSCTPMNSDSSITLPNLVFWNKSSTISSGLSYLFYRIFTLISSRINVLLEKVETALPCMCEITNTPFSRINNASNNRWLMPLRGLKFDDLVQMFRNCSAFGVEMSRELVQIMASPLICKNCGMNFVESISDLDILNWICIFTGVVNAYDSKIKRLCYALDSVLNLCPELKPFYESLNQARSNINGVYSQCLSHMVYIKQWCPRDPLHIFMVIKSFYHALQSIHRELIYNLNLVSHIEKIDDFKILELGNSLVITHSFISDFINIERINLNNMSRTSSIVTPETPKLQSIEALFDEEIQTEEINKNYTIEEFLDTSYNFGILFPSPGRDYVKVICKIINTAPITYQSIICTDYSTVMQPRRDIGNIISNSLFSAYHFSYSEGLVYYIKLRPFLGINTLKRIYNATMNTHSNGILCRPFLFSVKRLASLFRIKWQHKSHRIMNDLTSRVWAHVIEDKVAKGYFKAALECYETKGVINVRDFELFYGIPIVYTNHRIHCKSYIDKNTCSILPLSDIFIEHLSWCSNEYLIAMSISKRVVSHLFSLSIGGVETNCILSSVQCIVTSISKGNTMNYVSDPLNSDSIERTDESNTIDVDVFSKYRVTTYYPAEFHDLRKKSCGDDFNFVRSLSRSIRMSNTGGKSGSPIFQTYDGKFTIKLINKHEMALFVAEGHRFFEHFSKGATLMSIPYGLYKIYHNNSNTSVNCFVMQNINNFASPLKTTFDIKGIAFKRFIVSTDGYTVDEPQDLVLLDQNFKEYTGGCPIQLEKNTIIHIKKNILRDLQFLSSINIVDYSLLLHIFPQHGIITLGLIDFLRPYTWDKQIETIGKKLANIRTGQEPTIISPNEYKIRFLQFIDKIFSSAPNQDMNIKINKSCRVTEKLYPKLLCMCTLCSTLKQLYSNPQISSHRHHNMLTCPQARRYIRSLTKHSSNCSKVELKLEALVEKIYAMQ